MDGRLRSRSSSIIIAPAVLRTLQLPSELLICAGCARAFYLTRLQLNFDAIHQRTSMTPEELLADLRARIVGHTVRRRRLATNSLLVYIDADPGDETGITLWFEPTWHLRDETRVLTGSRQAQHDPDADAPDAGFEAAAAAVDALVGREVVSLSVTAATGDLTLNFDGGLTLCTFVSDPTADELWHIRDNATKRRLVRSAQSFAITSPDV